MDKLLFLYIFITLQFSMIFDWLVQTNWEATHKFKHWNARFIHALIYASLTEILMVFMGFGQVAIYIASILFLTHYHIDNRKLVMWWMINVKRIPKDQVNYGPNGEVPTTWWLNIAIDQWFHCLVNFIIAIVVSYVCIIQL